MVAEQSVEPRLSLNVLALIGLPVFGQTAQLISSASTAGIGVRKKQQTRGLEWWETWISLSANEA